MTLKRVLPADVYDTLEFSALAFGGIGRGKMNNRFDIPYCAIGHAQAACGFSFDGGYEDSGADPSPITRELEAIGIDWRVNDYVLRDISVSTRISFPEWCKALNVVRGK